ncbi:MAG: 4-hydroxy-3-methylbut-2-enyl diphosphate reductase [Candidatus Moranbacteria bacterium RIFOXYA2_FULL_43_15]|nr:MAG: 4-hydroxy-3-methylbut-2-enyl diphosphate reductase [Candidatus Moranbacteria bacterium RIFOXYA2_FULL_43_15]
MKIHLSQFAGFCGGVKRAYDMVAGLDMAAVKQPVFILGSLVHNPEVNKKIKERGILEISRENFFAALPGEIGTVIITAHGTGPDAYAAAKEKNIDVIDATCPKVIKVQRLAQVYKKRGYKIVLVGDRGHKEVRGIDEWGGGESIIISGEDDLKNMEKYFERSAHPKTSDVFSPKNIVRTSDVREKKIAVLAQTTQNEDFVKKVGEIFKKKYPDAEVLPTTCGATHERQREVKKLAKEHEAVLVIGSPTSANSTRLFEIASAINPETHFIDNSSELKKEWFSGIGSVAVTAGASAPKWVIEDVVARLRLI